MKYSSNHKSELVTTDEMKMTIGIVAKFAFGTDKSITLRPSLAGFLSSPHLKYKSLKDLGIDSLGFMSLLTRIEEELDIEFPEAMLLQENISIFTVAENLLKCLRQKANAQSNNSIESISECKSCEDRYVVIDNFLSDSDLRTLRENFQQTQFDSIDSVVNAKIDNFAFRSKGQVLSHYTKVADKPYLEIIRALKKYDYIAGKPGEDWRHLSLAFWRYPPGARLGWHDDAGRGRSGEFILYLHQAWRASWGGELIIQNNISEHERILFTETDPFKRVDEAVSGSSTDLVAILPKPNRLILMKAATPHYVNRVDAAAGKSSRLSLAGFTAFRSLDKYNQMEKLDLLEEMFLING